jgi:O-antigen ligase
MIKTFLELELRAKLNFALLGVFILIAFLFGGASRADVLSQPVVRLAAVLAIAVFAVQLDRAGWRAIRLALLFLGAVAAVILAQLIPLPPETWAALPGRALYAEAIGVAGLPPVWRPLSLTPDLTVNASLSLLPPLALVLGLGVIGRKLYALLIPVLLVAAAISAVVGVIQVSSGLFYLYRITNEGSLVGFFANRNHQALFFAVAFPLLACWAASPSGDRAYAQLRNWIALCVGVALVPLLLVTGSRGGLMLGAIGIVAALAITFRFRRERGMPIFNLSLRAGLLLLIPIMAGVAAVGATIYLARDEAIQRLQEGPTNELRSRNLPLIVELTRDHLPLGTGFGSFDTVFRSHEARATLSEFYLNHAHNDWIEVVLEGGLLPVPLILIFLGWFALRAWRLWVGNQHRDSPMLGRAGSAIVAIVLVGSALDYPLRTPFVAVLFALGSVWMLAPPRRADEPVSFEKTGLAV